MLAKQQPTKTVNKFLMVGGFKFIQMVSTMTEIGSMDCNMGLERRRIQLINIFTKDSGKTDKRMEKDRSSGKTDLGMMVIGNKEINMGMENFMAKTTGFTLDNGRIISYTDKENSPGLTVKNILENTLRT